jgi:hypothetical protein
MKGLSYLRTFLGLFIALKICLLFGFTGSLIRVVGLQYVRQVSFLKHLFFKISKRFLFINPDVFIRLFVLVIIFLAFGNVFSNYSFLLSALGVCAVQIANHMVNVLHSKETYLRQFLTKRNPLFYSFIKYLETTILTSLIIGLILMPLMTTNLFSSILANLITQPLVGFIITPLSLLLSFGEVNFIPSFVFEIFDEGLKILKNCARLFASLEAAPAQSLFSFKGQSYLSILLLLLWSLEDLHFVRKRQMLKKQLK